MYEKHGDTKTRLYKIWEGMKARCYNSKAGHYEKYGGRGIEVCNQWKYSFPVFKEWALQNGYEEHLTIERKDNNKGYTPENCRWATRAEQVRNKRDNLLVTYNGETKCLMEWSRKYGINYWTLKARYYKGKTGGELFKPVRKVGST